MDALDLARWQFGITTVYHFLFVPITIGLSGIVAWMHTRWVRHHRDVDCVFWDTPDDGPRPGDNNGGDRYGGGHRHAVIAGGVDRGAAGGDAGRLRRLRLRAGRLGQRPGRRPANSTTVARCADCTVFWEEF